MCDATGESQGVRESLQGVGVIVSSFPQSGVIAPQGQQHTVRSMDRHMMVVPSSLCNYFTSTWYCY